ncbi:tandem-type lipoprotein [Staphylococcus hyicus]|uniref:tandem-type lipoprotein n=1 Tax=Staphylococcus hyicus TaxID=1284 RepID=UPI00211C75C9|nr:tandem-type lipoprotein [Staphylococcus hyicus]MCQ9291534.1 tandem-type lipoprotein [Staphylococcus hyicus]MCQ9306775.1 tandem-type lipoprotein [Staphylococcus hyicus]MCQ9309586.1 tandem-type lipoprotein [Staphylococcus hyicus]MCQ9311609.1 tandem-type lipoprotein [Staphylococcus hyicus]MDP4448640.1 tandem-type lipoprotein [Staphylococcus hyicus]
MKKLTVSMILILVAIFSSSCGFMSNKNEIKQSFNKSLEMYPIKNLEDFYDKEGFRDTEFDENDKGTWILLSEIAVKRKPNDKLIVKGMVLQINRNTRKSEGEYYIRKIGKDSATDDEEIKYPIKMENNKIKPRKAITDEQIKREIESFKFFVQSANFKDLNSYGQGVFDYNPNVPSYSAEYQLSNNDYNVKQLRTRYDIPTNKAPKLIIKGVGEFEGSSIGYKDLKIDFSTKKGESIYYSDGVEFVPSEDGN